MSKPMSLLERTKMLVKTVMRNQNPKKEATHVSFYSAKDDTAAFPEKALRNGHEVTRSSTKATRVSTRNNSYPYLNEATYTDQSKALDKVEDVIEDIVEEMVEEIVEQATDND